MKIKSNPLNQVILAAHGKILRHSGITYLVRAQKLGCFVLADAEPMNSGGKLINLFDRHQLARELRQMVEKRCFS